MISHKYKCIFVHIPKCAGTSIEELLGHFDGHKGREGQDHRSIRMIQTPVPVLPALKSIDNAKDLARRFREPFRKHANPNNKLIVNHQQYSEYFKFSIVRNPWLRLHSWYRNVIRDSIHQKNYRIPYDISFEDFVIQFAGTGYLRPQTYWLKDFQGNIQLDYIGKFEAIDDSFSYIAQKLGIADKVLPHKLDSNKEDISKDFTPKVVDFIGEYYAEEIKLFNYTFV